MKNFICANQIATAAMFATMAGALLLSGMSIAFGADVRTGSDVVRPFLGTWYVISQDCSDCTNLCFDPSPMLVVETMAIKMSGQKIHVSFKVDETHPCRHFVRDRWSYDDVRLEGNELHCFVKPKAKIKAREDVYVLSAAGEIEEQCLDPRSSRSQVCATYSRDPGPLRDALARHPTSDQGLLAAVVAGIAQAPMPPASPARQPSPQGRTATQPQYPAGQGGQTSTQGAGAQPSSASGDAGVSGPGPMASPTCVGVQQNPDGHGAWGILNRCNYDINIQFCVQNAKSSLSCQSTPQGGLAAVKANSWEYALPFYGEEGEGTVIFAACIAPTYPVNWGATISSRYVCR